MKRTMETSVTSIPCTAGRRILSIGLLVLLGTGVACKPKKKAPPPPAQAAEEVQPDTVPQVVQAAPPPAPVAYVPPVEVRPSCDQNILMENGTGAVRMGDARDSVRLRCQILSDSTVTDNEGVHGTIVIGMGSASAVAQVAGDHVNGLFVTDPQFRTADGLGPGTQLRMLMDMSGAMVLEGINDLSIVVGAHCGLFFQIPKPKTLPPNGQMWKDVVLAMPTETTIQRVTVRGCH